MKFTIAIPAYKALYFERCLESVLNQDYPDYEVIVLNDASPDPIQQIYEAMKNDRCRYYQNEINAGSMEIVSNWNRLLQYATGDYIVMMGDDDLLAPRYLSEFAGLIQKYPELDVYHCRPSLIDEAGRIIGFSHTLPERESTCEFLWCNLAGGRMKILSDFVYRTTALKQKGGFYHLPLGWGSDEITAMMMCGDKGIAHLNKSLFFFRKSAQQISSVGGIETKIDTFYPYLEWLNRFIRERSQNTPEEKLMYEQAYSSAVKRFEKERGFYLSLYFKKHPIRAIGKLRSVSDLAHLLYNLAGSVTRK